MSYCKDGCGRTQEELARLRAALTTAQQRCSDLKLAMGDEAGWFDRYTAERAAHAETRKALEELRAKYDADLSNAEVARMLELAKAEARVKELEHHWDEHCRMHKEGCYRG